MFWDFFVSFRKGRISSALCYTFKACLLSGYMYMPSKGLASGSILSLLALWLSWIFNEYLHLCPSFTAYWQMIVQAGEVHKSWCTLRL